ncbi:molybdopterin-dependent oxidoreductase [Halobacteriaceae archaeon GCM10025711]
MSESDGRPRLTRRSLLKAGAVSAAALGVGGAASLSSGAGDASAQGGAPVVAHGNCWDCHKLCGQRVTVQDGKAIDLTGVDGHPRGSGGPGRNGTLCPKGMSQIEKAYDPERIRQPMVKDGDGYRKASWDEALTLAAEKLQAFSDEHGPEKLLFAPGWATTDLSEPLFQSLYGTPEIMHHPIPTCAGGWLLTAGLMGIKPGGQSRYVDYQNTDYIIAWGRNPLETFGGQWEAKNILDAVERGATLVTIDPVKTTTAQKSDIYLPIKPRTDGALALAMANVIIEEGLYDREFVDEWTHGFEQYKAAVADKTPEWAAEITGLDAGDIREVAIGFAKAAPRAGVTSWTGLGQYGESHKAAQNVLALQGLVGNIDRKGGMRFWKSAPLANAFEKRGIELPENHKGKPRAMATDDYPFMWSISHTMVPRAVEKGDLRGAFFYYRNPLKDGNTKAWQRALEEMDLVITIDSYWSGVAKRADIVFPEATQLEKPMLGSGGAGAYPTKTWVTGSKAAIEPQWDTRSGFDILVGLAEKMGYGEYFPWATEEEYLNDKLSGLGMTLDELDASNYELVDDYGYEFWREKGFATPTKKFQFSLDKVPPYMKSAKAAGLSPAPEWVPPGTFGDVADDEYPLEMLDVRVVFFSHGGDQSLQYALDQFARRYDMEAFDYRGNYLLLNGSDAADRSVATGDMVSVSSAVGEMELMALVTEAVRPGTVVVTPYGFGEDSIQPDQEGGNNMLLHGETIEPISGMVDRHVAVEVTASGGEPK